MHKFYLFLILTFLFTFYAEGQAIEGLNQEPWVQKTFRKGMKLKQQKKYDKSLKLFNRILQKHPDYLPAYQQKASIFYAKEDLGKAAENLESIHIRDSLYHPDIYYSLGVIYEKQKKRSQALAAYSSYLRHAQARDRNVVKAEKKKRELAFIIEAMANPVPFKAVDPGPAINTPQHEYLATVDISGKEMVFTRRVNHQEDLFYSEKINGQWTEAEAIESLNTPYNEGAHCLSPDGRFLYFTVCENRRTLGSCDIFVSSRAGGQWTAAKNLGARVNSPSWDAQPIVSADGNTLYFSSSRPGGYGGRDIWYCTKDRSGQWSEPKNAGERINTAGNEESPFLHPDGKHLYIRSDGHLGMGANDLFVAHWEGNKWSEPVNLGYPINTEMDEGAIRVAADGKTAYMATDRLKKGEEGGVNLDIISFELAPGIRSEPVNYVEGIVRDKENKKALQVQISLFDNLSGKWILDQTTTMEGKFILALPSGKDYHLSIEHPGYVFYSDRFELDSLKKEYRPIELIIELSPVNAEGLRDTTVKEEEFILKNVFFESGSAEMDTVKSRIELSKLIRFLNDNETLKIRIEGHTDDVGSRESNQLLSDQRAEVVYWYLIKKGIDPQRLSFKGFGETEPVADNTSAEGRKKNRRTSFSIVEN
jgi:outer membrane protein OmpA-like peptidoglycan-associated protein/tetratricopeptide (TPR) repeat protein